MTETFYRLHTNPQAPAFNADNAYSGLWGSTWSEDGTQTECHDCNGQGRLFDDDPDCGTCDGTGWEDASEGYSSCASAEELLDYFGQHSPADDADPVVVFEGAQVGIGFDGEPLVIPATVIRWTTIGALRAGKE